MLKSSAIVGFDPIAYKVVDEMRRAGCSSDVMLEAGRSAGVMQDAGRSPGAMHEAGQSPHAMRIGGPESTHSKWGSSSKDMRVSYPMFGYTQISPAWNNHSLDSLSHVPAVSDVIDAS